MSKIFKAPPGSKPSGVPPQPTIDQFAKSLRAMLDCYWGKGDGQSPPEFIRIAKMHLDNYDFWEARK